MQLTGIQARQIVLGAQGMGGERDRQVGMRGVQRVVSTLGQFQIDSVNVLVRAHFMPLFSRLGAYDTSLLTRAAGTPPRRVFEFWGHAASLIDVELYPALQFRRADAYHQVWGRMRTLVDSHPEVVEEVASALDERGPATARELDRGEQRRKDQWGWNWSVAKTALEWLFWCGRAAVAGRNCQFERIYDIPERVIPPQYIAACQPWAGASASEREELARAGHIELVRRAARALGVGTARCLGDYFRTHPEPTRQAIAALVSTGELVEATVEGVRDPVWVWHAARSRPVRGASLVCPFDSLVFERKRLASFFGVDYSIGLYTPPDKRIHGYYVYLFLLDGQFVARTDLKADRAQGLLRVQSAWLEPDAEPIRHRVGVELTRELRRLADWLALTDVVVADKGDLSPTLARRVAV